MNHPTKPEPVNARLLAALNAAKPYVERIALTNPTQDSGIKRAQEAMTVWRECRDAIAEAEARAKPDAPSYDELLDNLARFCGGDFTTVTALAWDEAVGQLLFLRYQSRALLKRAGREG